MAVTVAGRWGWSAPIAAGGGVPVRAAHGARRDRARRRRRAGTRRPARPRPAGRSRTPQPGRGRRRGLVAGQRRLLGLDGGPVGPDRSISCCDGPTSAVSTHVHVMLSAVCAGSVWRGPPTADGRRTSGRAGRRRARTRSRTARPRRRTGLGLVLGRGPVLGVDENATPSTHTADRRDAHHRRAAEQTARAGTARTTGAPEARGSGRPGCRRSSRRTSACARSTAAAGSR